MKSIAARLATAACVSLIASYVQASLGDLEATVEADRLAADATLRTTPGARFTLHELQTPAGATIREYASPTGVVFGVAWRGPRMPDLRQLLGTHFDEYIDAVAQRRMRRAPVSIQLPDLVVQSGGHMHTFSGRAYLPSAVPSNVSPQEIQ